MRDILKGEVLGLSVPFKEIVKTDNVKIMSIVKNSNLTIYINDNTLIREVVISTLTESDRIHALEEILLRPNSTINVLKIETRVVDLRLYSIIVEKYKYTDEKSDVGYTLNKKEFELWCRNTITSWYEDDSRIEYCRWIKALKDNRVY